MKKTQSLAWHDKNLSDAEKALESERAVLAAQMRKVVCMEQDNACLRGLITDARSRGKRSLPVDWRDREFKGRRTGKVWDRR